MKVSASMYHHLYNKIRVVGTRNEAGECLVNEVYKVGSSLNLLEFEFRDRRFPCGGFSRNDVAEMNTLLEKEGVEFVSKKEKAAKEVSDSAPRFSVEVHDVVDATKVKVVQEMPYVRGQPSQKTLSWIRTELDLPAHKAAETTISKEIRAKPNREKALESRECEAAEQSRKVEGGYTPWDGRNEPDWAETPRDGK